MRTFSIEIKIILGVIFFTLMITGFERYQLSKNIITQFENSKKSKNKLLLDTMLPILSLNILLGLDDANREYLNLIVKQNKDIQWMQITNKKNQVLFLYPDDFKVKEVLPDGIKICCSEIIDNITNESIGNIKVKFSDDEYEQVRLKNKETTIRVFAVTLILLGVFLYFLRREFKHFRKLIQAVLVYDPKLNNFDLEKSERTDEVGVIHNAIVGMVARIGTYTKLLDEMNSSLEEKIEERTKLLQKANEKLEQMTMTDPLTKIANRRHFEEYVENIWELALRTNTKISLVMCDIDFFKNVNDTYGHITGDEVLKNVAHTIVNSLKRSSDLAARYGGEEFVIILYDTDLQGAWELCREIAEQLKNPKNFKVNGIEIAPFTMSFGVSSVVPTKDHTYKDLLEFADEALYRAKESGRNRVITLEFDTNKLSIH
ncbi:MAG: diguanylate cyclase [Thiovulaceae bacterium]|nr:diguanylate cyclase [Sulfurimonadaceae bacterium]